MPRRPGQPVISIQLSVAQREALDSLVGNEPINQYVRRLIAQDAHKRKLNWPMDLGKWNPKD